MSFNLRYRFTRSTWIITHRYLALIAGLFFALMGLTGSVGVYRAELDELLNPELVVEHPSGKRQSLDAVMNAVRQAHPERYGTWTLEMPSSPHGMITAWYDKPRETFFERYAPLMVSVNPYTAEVVASRFWGQTLTTWLLDLHTQLGLDSFGWNAVGVLGLLLMISVISGIYLWWPGIRGILATLKIDINTSLVRLAFDWHRLSGLLAAPIILLLALTGVHLSFPGILETLTGSSGMAHGSTGNNIVSTATPNNYPVGLESAEFIARGPFPRAELRRVTTPAGNGGIYRINLRQNGEINRRHPYTTVWVDRWSGHIKEVRDPFAFSTGETLSTWLWPIHTGEAFGPPGRLLWFVNGISVFLLYVSGLIRWLFRQGLVKDRKLAFASLKTLLYRTGSMLYRFGLILVRLGRFLLNKAKDYAPHVRKAGILLLQSLIAMLNRQKRLGHDKPE